MLETVMIHHVARHTDARIGPRATYVVTPSQLKGYLEQRRNWEAVPCGPEIERASDTQRFLVSFDDGYRNNLTEALPVLEKHGVPCVLFVTTGFAKGDVYPYELELADVISGAEKLHLPDRKACIELQGERARSILYKQVRLPLKARTQKRREDFMRELAALNCYDREDFQSEEMLSMSEVKALSQHPLVTIGAHTHTHVLLSRQSWNNAYVEMKRSKKILESAIGEKVNSFSYPYGGNTFMVRLLARYIGFKYAFSTKARWARRIRSHNRLAIPRIDINGLVEDE